MLSTETMDAIAKWWTVKVDGTMKEGFPTRLEALRYYRSNILPNNPKSVSLWFTTWTNNEPKLAYTII